MSRPLHQRKLALRARRLAAGLLALGFGGAADAAVAKPLTDPEMTSFLVQCIGTDKAGLPLLPGPNGGCQGAAPQTVSSRAAWSKHDWPDVRNAEEVPRGQQASDSVLDTRLGFPVIVQTFDFGNAGRRFKGLDRPGGDGGDAMAVRGGAAWIFFTEDGGLGQQWFMGPGCRDGQVFRARLESWLAFGSDVRTGAWTDRVALYRMTRSPDECPTDFRSAYTRYRRDRKEVPIRIVRDGKAVETRTAPVDTILSEHFGGESIAEARQMERFYFGRGLGKYRWEAWAERSRTRMSDADGEARYIAASGRCMPLPGSEAPAPGWIMVDCRTWTNLVREGGGWTVADFGWPGPLLDALREPGR